MSDSNSKSLAESLATLGLALGASEREIRKAYLRLVKLHKPDQDPRGFQALRAAYERLMEAHQGPAVLPGTGGNASPEGAPAQDAKTPTGSSDAAPTEDGRNGQLETPIELLRWGYFSLADPDRQEEALEKIEQACVIAEGSDLDFVPPKYAAALARQLLARDQRELAQRLLALADKAIELGGGYRMASAELLHFLELLSEVAHLPKDFPPPFFDGILEALPQGERAIAITLQALAIEFPEAAEQAARQLEGLTRLGGFGPLLRQPAKEEAKRTSGSLFVLGFFLLYLIGGAIWRSDRSPGRPTWERIDHNFSIDEVSRRREPEKSRFEKQVDRLCSDDSYGNGKLPFCRLLGSAEELFARGDCDELERTPWPERPRNPDGAQDCPSFETASILYARELEPVLLETWNEMRTRCGLAGQEFDLPKAGKEKGGVALLCP